MIFFSDLVPHGRFCMVQHCRRNWKRSSTLLVFQSFMFFHLLTFFSILKVDSDLNNHTEFISYELDSWFVMFVMQVQNNYCAVLYIIMLLWTWTVVFSIAKILFPFFHIISTVQYCMKWKVRVRTSSHDLYFQIVWRASMVSTVIWTVHPASMVEYVILSWAPVSVLLDSQATSVSLVSTLCNSYLNK